MKSVVLILTLSTSFVAALPAAELARARPHIEVPGTFRDVENPVSWKTAEPADSSARGEWWKRFGDPALDELVARALAENQDLRAAVARVEQARAAAGLARSNYLPSLALNASAERTRGSTTVDNALPVNPAETLRVPFDLNWEIDLFGRVRGLHESARADAASAAALAEAVRLTLTADVAANYFTLRALEAELALLERTVALRRDARQLVQARFDRGSVGEVDLARAETELAVAEAESAALRQRRAALQNALAVLVGDAAPRFAPPSLKAAASANVADFAIPVGLPSALLERRPDIAAAERALQSASARIGVAKAAFFPAISLTGSAGYASGELDQLFTWDSRVWSVGPRLYLPIFQGGRNRANLARSQATYEEAVANFRQRVLVAFREVQDALTATRYLADQIAAQERAFAGARRSAELSQKRYDSGIASYLDVIDSQRTALAAERATVQLAGQRAVTRVALIKALGGSW